MKKLAALILCALSITVSAKIDKENFDKDMAYYNAHKDDAKAITILLSQFNSDRDGIREAFEGYATGDITKWKKTLDKLKSARQYRDKLDELSYFHACRSSVIYADLMWSSGASMRNNPTAWDDPNDFYAKQFKEAKRTFQDNFAECKQTVSSAPQEKDYEEKEGVEKVGSWELNQ